MQAADRLLQFLNEMKMDVPVDELIYSEKGNEVLLLKYLDRNKGGGGDEQEKK